MIKFNRHTKSEVKLKVKEEQTHISYEYVPQYNEIKIVGEKISGWEEIDGEVIVYFDGQKIKVGESLEEVKEKYYEWKYEMRRKGIIP